MNAPHAKERKKTSETYVKDFENECNLVCLFFCTHSHPLVFFVAIASRAQMSTKPPRTRQSKRKHVEGEWLTCPLCDDTFASTDLDTVPAIPGLVKACKLCMHLQAEVHNLTHGSPTQNASSAATPIRVNVHRIRHEKRKTRSMTRKEASAATPHTGANHT
jgi:hypothetical protein